MLKKIQQIDKKAVIAGGAPRNWYYGKLANDIDIYVTNQIVDFVVLMDSEGFTLHNVFKGVYEDSQFICGVVDCLSDTLNVQLIRAVQDFHPARNFDIGLCMIWHNGSETVVTNEFLRDFKNNTLTIFPKNVSDKQMCRMVTHHIPKLMNQFPEHRLIIDKG